MPAVNELPHPADAPFLDRRRPGRAEEVNPALLPLLRGTAHVNDNQAACTTPAVDEDDPDNLAAAKGIIMGVGLSAGFWLCLGALVWWF